MNEIFSVSLYQGLTSEFKEGNNILENANEVKKKCGEDGDTATNESTIPRKDNVLVFHLQEIWVIMAAILKNCENAILEHKQNFV